MRRSLPFCKLTAHKFLTANQKINVFDRYQGYVTCHLKRPGSPGDEDARDVPESQEGGEMIHSLPKISYRWSYNLTF